MENATSEQLNLAARISLHRKIDFETALELVLTDPEAANSALTPNKPVAFRTPQPSGLSGSEIKELLSEVYAKGRSDVEQDMRIAKLESEFASVDNRVNALGQGFGSHIKQHMLLNAGEIPAIDPQQDMKAMLDALDPKFRDEFLSRLPENVKAALTNGKPLEAAPDPAMIEEEKPKKRGLFS